MTPIKFAMPPEIGTAFLVNGQPYRLDEVRSHRRQDGFMTTLLNWRSHCPDCGASFIFTTGHTITHVNRRCELHRKGGKRVRGQRILIAAQPSKGKRHD
jgi:hypothetical protein